MSPVYIYFPPKWQLLMYRTFYYFECDSHVNLYGAHMCRTYTTYTNYEPLTITVTRLVACENHFMSWKDQSHKSGTLFVHRCVYWSPSLRNSQMPPRVCFPFRAGSHGLCSHREGEASVLHSPKLWALPVNDCTAGTSCHSAVVTNIALPRDSAS